MTAYSSRKKMTDHCKEGWQLFLFKTVLTELLKCEKIIKNTLEILTELCRFR